MTANSWADPAGYEHAPPRVRYRIRDVKSGEVVERLTVVTQDYVLKRWFHGLGWEDQHFAQKIASLTQRACAYFYERDDAKYVPLKGIGSVRITDTEVRARIDRMNRGENLREALRVQRGTTAKKREWYPLDQLPFDQQRALVEQIEALKRAWMFEIVGELADDVPPPTPTAGEGIGDDYAGAGIYG